VAFYLEGAVVESALVEGALVGRPGGAAWWGGLVGRVSPVLPRRIEMGHCVVISLW